jgi:phage terminase small subunit
MSRTSLTAKQMLFAEEYLVDLNATQAARRAGSSIKTAVDIGRQLLRKAPVARQIELAMAQRSARTQITADRVLQRWWDIANANANDVVQYRRGACRYCYGIGHAFQWRSRREFDEACAEAKLIEKPEPTCDGGFDYDQTLSPHAKCPECCGEGVGRVLATDTAKLTGSALLLFDGVKATKDSLEIKLRDRDKAMENIARHLGVFNDKLKLGGDAENPLTLLIRQIQGSALPVIPNPPVDEDDW